MPVRSTNRTIHRDAIATGAQRPTPPRGRAGASLAALALGMAFSAYCAAQDPSELAASAELTPMLPEGAAQALQFGERRDLTMVIAVDEGGNYQLYRGRNAKNDGKEMPFPIDGNGISSMNTFTIFKTNPWCVFINGNLICIEWP